MIYLNKLKSNNALEKDSKNLGKWIFLVTGVISIILGCLFAQPLTYFLITLLPKDIHFVALNPFDGFLILMWVGLAISLAFFGLIFCLWAYFNLRDALFEKEKKIIAKFILPASFLFIFGLVFGLFIYLKVMLPYFVETNTLLGIENMWSLYNVLIIGINLSILLGLCFEIPLILRGLLKIGLLKKKKLEESRGIVVFIICFVSAVITPTPDLLSMFIVAVPLYLLFELSMFGFKH